MITPTPDVMAQTMLAVPMLALYVLGIAVAWAFGRPRRAAEVSGSEA